MFDVIIVGAGPNSLNAALVLGRRSRRYGGWPITAVLWSGASRSLRPACGRCRLMINRPMP